MLKTAYLLEKTIKNLLSVDQDFAPELLFASGGWGVRSPPDPGVVTSVCLYSFIEFVFSA